MELPKDVIEQLVGTSTGWDQFDTMGFVFYKPSKFPGADNASVDFAKGTVTVEWFGGDGDAKEVVKKETYHIKAELVKG